MQLLRFAVATVNFAQPLREALKTAVETGAQGIQLALHKELRPDELTDTARRQFLHYLDELSLKISSLHLPMRRELTDMDRIDERLAEIRKMLEFAWSLKVPHVTLRIGRIPTDAESKEYETLRQVLNDLARHSNHVGSTLCLIPTNDSPESMLQMLTAVTAGPMGVDFDPAGFVTAGQNPIKALRVLHAHVLHVQGRDGLRDIDGSGLETPLGRGQVEWDELMALLLEIPYRGWITINRTQGDHRIIQSADAIKYLTEIGYQ
jgi:sugar phosphate isomerase/epimerase